MGNFEDFSWDNMNPNDNAYDKASQNGKVREADGIPVSHNKVQNPEAERRKEEQYRKTINSQQVASNNVKQRTNSGANPNMSVQQKKQGQPSGNTRNKAVNRSQSQAPRTQNNQQRKPMSNQVQRPQVQQPKKKKEKTPEEKEEARKKAAEKKARYDSCYSCNCGSWYYRIF